MNLSEAELRAVANLIHNLKLAFQPSGVSAYVMPGDVPLIDQNGEVLGYIIYKMNEGGFLFKPVSA